MGLAVTEGSQWILFGIMSQAAIAAGVEQQPATGNGDGGALQDLEECEGGFSSMGVP